MMLLTCRKIKKNLGPNPILKEINLDITQKDRIGLIGQNGSGKTTLALILAQREPPDSGKFTFHLKKPRIGFLPQNPVENGQDNDPLSGGEITRKALKRLLKKRPHFLILDEPTNHLDYSGINWLLEQLNSFSGAVLTISHDRYFLDQTTTKTIEINSGKAFTYNGNYSFFRKEKEHFKKTLFRQHQKEKREQKKINQEIKQVKEWARKGHETSTKKEGLKEKYRARAKKKDRQAQSKIKRLEKMQKAETKAPEKDPEWNVDLKSNSKRGKAILQAEKITKSFDGKTLFKDSSFFILRGEKVGLWGPNGTGKTTLLSVILGQEKPDSGIIWLSPSAQPAFLPQKEEKLPPHKSIRDFLQSSPQKEQEKALLFLARMGLEREAFSRPLHRLSYGERKRFQMCRLLLENPDLLLLDEPTTHLDVFLRESLEEVLSEYEGTLLLVSHDRYFIENICSSFLLFSEGTLQKTDTLEKEANPENEDLILIETKIASILGKLGELKIDDPQYKELDREFQRLIQKKRALQKE